MRMPTLDHGTVTVILSLCNRGDRGTCSACTNISELMSTCKMPWKRRKSLKVQEGLNDDKKV